MASLSSPSFSSPSSTYTSSRNTFYKFHIRNPRIHSPSSSPLKFLSSSSSCRVSNVVICRCQKNSDSSPLPEDEFNGKLDSLLHEAMRNVTKSFDDFVKFYRNPLKENMKVEVDVKEMVVEEKEEEEDWNWDQWMKYIKELEEEEKTVSVLKAKLGDAVGREDYEDAAKLKVGIAAASANDTVGRVISQLNEERFEDAAFIRDNAGAGLIGWWAGTSDGSDDPYGRIIRISAEHGRYVARSYSPRQLATATPGAPLFEVFLSNNNNGEYRQLVVCLKRSSRKSGDSSTKSSDSSDQKSDLNPLNGPSEGKSGLSALDRDDLEKSKDKIDDSNLTERLADLQNKMRDMIPDVKVKLKLSGPGKLDGPIKFVEQISDEDDEEETEELVTPEMDDVKAESSKHQDEIVVDSAGGISNSNKDDSDLEVKIVFGGFLQKLSNPMPSKDLIRVPAKIEKKGRLSFSFSINTGDNEVETDGKVQASHDKSVSISGHRIMVDIAKVVNRREKIPRKVLKDVGELIMLRLNQAQNRQTLSGTTTFNRIEVPESSDALSGLYIGALGINTSEVIHLRRNFGQWQEDDANQKSPNLEFYEYVEALKLTGDPYVPAGQVAFRAKIGKQYQLPHKGIFPEELGVVARYKGQGRLAESGFHSPRWVDGELVIINSKYIKGGPVVGFVYWAPEYHFLVFFNRLRLQS
ncbi:hypothetical protein AQUCO_01000277v1 [Aquilegia coerulea]|uniref:Uncharacterized protein n=1 Tax=Aquilegia coerulea TaxID=218851 RepID=A0A2G5E971_AQUCA|nr:hypothetical protein AQUCO_01000277v1 [Aquilegia coerulea]